MTIRGLFVAALAALQLSSPALAPSGTLRAGFIADNPVQAQVDPRTGAVSGPAADLVKELAKRLNVQAEIIPLPTAEAVIDAVKAKRVDIGFLAYEAARAKQ